MLSFFGLCGDSSSRKLKPGQIGIQVHPINKRIKKQNKNQSKIPLLNSTSENIEDSSFKTSITKQLNSPLNELLIDPKKFTQTQKNQLTVLRTIEKSPIQQIKKNLKQKKQKYIDLQFPPNQKSIGKDIKILKQVKGWVRVSQLYKEPVFFQNDVDPNDVIQGYSIGSGNCYFMSAIADLAQNPQRIKKIFGSTQVSKEGIYYATLFYQGHYKQIIVDDYIPVNAARMPLFSRPPPLTSQIWVQILQKCYAKLFGSYESMIGGLPSEAYYALTGAPTFFFNIGLNSTKQQLAKYWQRILQSYQKDFCMNLGTPQSLDPTKLIRKNHAYSILGAYELMDLKILKLRNPMGMIQWNGRASDQDEEFWKKIPVQIKQALGYENKNNGVFFMLWEDIPTYFILFQICQYKDNASLLSIRTKFTMKNANMFQLQTSGGEVIVSLVEDTKRGLVDLKTYKYSKSCLIISKKIQGTKGQILFKIVRLSAKIGFAAHHQKLSLQPGRYAIYAKYQWNDQIDKQASYIVYSDSSMQIRQGTQQQFPQFLTKSFMSILNQNQDFVQPKQDIIYVKKFFPLSGGFGFYAAKIRNDSKSRYSMQIDQQQLKKYDIRLKKPYRNKGKVKLILRPGKAEIILFRNKNIIIPQNLQVPDAKITRLD